MVLGQEVLSFPGAEGFGKYSKGGRGGKVITVTNLNDSGPGSLRQAIETQGARYIIFAVGGVIDLKSKIYISNPYVTIAGQTAPGDGVVLRGNGIYIKTHDVIMRFMRIRPGDVDFGEPNNWSGIDALSMGSENTNDVYNIMIDHCSFSWAVDENVGVWHSSKKITIQNSIISEALENSKHPEGAHSKGMLIGKEADSLSILNNYFAHNNERNPRLSNAGLVVFKNNIIYNPKYFGLKISNSKGKKLQKLDIINNYFFRGNSTKFRNEISIWNPSAYNGKIFFSNNNGFNGDSDWALVENWEKRESLKNFASINNEIPFSPISDPIKPLKSMLIHLSDKVGASLPIRDNIDSRVVQDFFKYRGVNINSQEEVGAWQGYETVESNIDIDKDGLPDNYQEMFNISQRDFDEDFDNDGYPNFEEFLNGTNPYDVINNAEEVFRSFSKNKKIESNDKKYDFFDEIIVNQNYPNPFEKRTALPIILFKKQEISVQVYNSLGQITYEENLGELNVGLNEFIWDATGLASGIYVIVVQTKVESKTRKVTLLNQQ